MFKFLNGWSQQQKIITVVIASTLIFLLYFINTNINKEKTVHLNEKTIAKKNAEYGMEKALEMIKNNPFWKDGFPSTKIGEKNEGFYSVKIESISDSSFRIICIGAVNDIKKTFIFEYKVINKDGKSIPFRLKSSWK